MKNHHEITASHLPFHIIHDMLLNLPLKSLIRFKAVAKQWCDLITGRNFARSQLLKHQNNVSSVILVADSLGLVPRVFYIDKHALEEADQSCEELQRVTPRLPTNPEFCQLSFINCCDGVLCYRDCHNKNHVLLWNPISNWYQKVPPPDGCSTEDMLLRGLGYNPSDDDYKLVKIVDDTYLEIMSLKSNSWKRICNIPNIFPDYCLNEFPTPSVSLNGVLYWLEGPSITSLDLTYETLSKVERPQSRRKFGETATRDYSVLTIFQGMLCLIWALKEDQIRDVWVMKEKNNWVKLFDVPLPSGCDYEQPMCCTHDAVILMSSYEVFVHDGKKCITRRFAIPFVENHKWWNSIGYVGTLVSPQVLVIPPAPQKKKRKLLIERVL